MRKRGGAVTGGLPAEVEAVEKSIVASEFDPHT